MMADRQRRREMLGPLIVVVVAAATLAFAWGFQLVGGYVPCKLCLEERIPYYVGLPVAAVALFAALAGARLGVVRALMLIAAVVFAVNVYLGGYHAGAEWGFWPGPSDCGAGAASSTTSVGDLLGQLDGIRIVSCTEATWRFLGLSFAGWNVVASVFLVVVALWSAISPKRGATKAASPSQPM